jgi:acetolactate synthase small subunit
VVYTGETTVVAEMAGTPDEVDDFLAAVQPLGVVEVGRSGRVTLTCDDTPLYQPEAQDEACSVLA